LLPSVLDMTSLLEASTAQQAENTGHPRRWLGLFAVLAATIMNLLDSTVVNIGGPSIERDLGGGYGTIQWTAAVYTLTLAVGLLTGGRLGDMYGRKRLLLIGVAGFVTASLLCGLAVSPETLIAARVMQGLFGAVMIPQGFGLIRDMFPPAEIGKAFGLMGPVIGLSTILGPIVAGALVNADLFGTGWRMIFLINLPLGLAALVLGATVLPSSTVNRSIKLDLLGTVLAAAGMFMLIFPLVQGRELGWPAWSLVMMALSAPVFAIFARYQRHRSRTGATPLIELSVFSKRSYVSGVVFVMAFFAAIVGVGLSIGMFLQLGFGYSAQHAALATAPWAVGAFLGTGVGATQGPKLGRRVLHIGLVGLAIGCGLLLGLLSWAGTGTSQLELAGPLLVGGFGMGMVFIPLFDIIMAGVEDHEVGSAAGALESLQQLGASLGVAVLGTVFFGGIGTRPTRATAVHATELTLLVIIALTATAFALAWLLPRKARG
jgi:EmrB/QacA subfamily drug resistance transporter